MAPRADRRLIALQRKLYFRLADQLARESGPTSTGLATLAKRYETEIPAGFTVVPRERLVADAARARVVFVGDFHTAPRVQREAATLLAEVGSRTKGRPLTLALEMVPARCQARAELFTLGRLDAEEFLASIRPQSRWPFPETGLLRCLEQARSLGARLLALDMPRDQHHGVRSRERFMAARLAEHCALDPDGCALVLVGGFHLLPGGLPRLFSENARARGTDPISLIVHQNVEAVHWALAQRGPGGTAVCRLDDGSYAIQNTHPLVLMESSLMQIGAGGAPDDLAPDPTDLMVEVVSSLARYLGVPESGCADFEVFTAADGRFLDTLRERGMRTRALVRAAGEIAAFDTLVLPELGVIYLHNPTLNHLSEAAARFLHARACPPAEEPGDAATLFVRSVLSQAAGFFGSTVFNPDRRPMGLVYFLRRLTGERGLRRRADLARALLRAARAVLGRRPHAADSLRAALAAAGPAVRAAAARALGQEVGARLMDAHRSGQTALAQVRALFRFDGGAAGLAEHPVFEPTARAS